VTDRNIKNAQFKATTHKSTEKTLKRGLSIVQDELRNHCRGGEHRGKSRDRFCIPLVAAHIQHTKGTADLRMSLHSVANRDKTLLIEATVGHAKFCETERHCLQPMGEGRDTVSIKYVIAEVERSERTLLVRSKGVEHGRPDITSSSLRNTATDVERDDGGVHAEEIDESFNVRRVLVDLATADEVGESNAIEVIVGLERHEECLKVVRSESFELAEVESLAALF